MAKQSILVVISNEMDRKTLVEHLALSNEFEIIAVSSSSECIDTVESNNIDLLLIDADMPNINCRITIGKLRKKGFAAPIFLLSSQCSDSDVIQRLKAGSNDVIGKPVNHPLLIEKIRVQFSQSNRLDSTSLRVGPFIFYPDSKLLMDKSGNAIGLSPMESTVLKVLRTYGQKPVSRRYLHQAVWDLQPGEKTNRLESVIWRLRQKIEKDPKKPTLLVTIGNGKGYMLNF